LLRHFLLMTRKIWLLVALAVFLGGLSLYFNRDWFSKDTIQIYHRSRPARAMLARRRKGPDDSLIDPLTFGFDRRLKLTCIKVIPLSDIQTNKYPHPIWHLISESNSAPVKDFMYGGNIPGMHPAVKEALPDPLEPGVGYRLVVETASFKGQHDFVPVARTQ
jgi:hypothetical protein